MRVCLTGMYSDGSNAAHLKDAILLERSVTIAGRGIDEIFSAKDALEAQSGQYSYYVVIIRPDDEGE